MPGDKYNSTLRMAPAPELNKSTEESASTHASPRLPFQPAHVTDPSLRMPDSMDSHHDDGGHLARDINLETAKKELRVGWVHYFYNVATTPVRAWQAVLDGVIEPTTELVTDVSSYWWQQGLRDRGPRFLQRRRLLQEMDAATSYAQWKLLAEQLDVVEGNDVWKREFASEYYNSKLVSDSLDALHESRRKGICETMFLLRSNLLRNLGGMGNEQLFSHCHVGTKKNIEQYVDEVVYQLEQIEATPDFEVTVAEKLAFFTDTRSAFGRSALLLSGGGALGLFHTGVLKVLVEANMLPRIISGSSVGSIVAGMLCTTPDSQLLSLLDPKRIHMDAFDRGGQDASWIRKLKRLFSQGYLCDIKVLEAACRSNMGNMTFSEAFEHTGRILNITVNSTGRFDHPKLLNYLTAPHVLVWSAACASCALSGLFAPVELIAKDASGNQVPWIASSSPWSDGSVESDLPMKRLSELFNVNHFIVSQVNPHVLPFMEQWAGKSWGPTKFLKQLVMSEIEYRSNQLYTYGWLPKTMFSIHNLLTQKYHGDITIVPQIELRDYLRVLENPSNEFVEHACRIGEQATWKKLALIENHLRIELALDRLFKKVKARVPQTPSGAPLF